mmetsp:Transcript_7142/g.7390  ORF Transcript_7142/g.7390 Transcript_7142/m.7390 type:complete len:91 (+) Transcript_7142:16-288(+)
MKVIRIVLMVLTFVIASFRSANPDNYQKDMNSCKSKKSEEECYRLVFKDKLSCYYSTRGCVAGALPPSLNAKQKEWMDIFKAEKKQRRLR